MGLQALDTGKKHRLITRSDFDGLVSAMLLSDIGVVGSISFAHPNDVQNGRVEVTPNDILTNLPYDEKALLVFDHHSSEKLRVPSDRDNWVINPSSPSAARLIWKSFGGSDYFGTKYDEMLEAVDRADSAKYRLNDILEPEGWDMLNFVMDARTGLGRFKDFRISNYRLMTELVDLCRRLPVEKILENPDVAERVALYRAHQDRFVDQLRRVTVCHGPIAEINLLGEASIWPGNRFMVYALYPEIKVSIHVMWGKSTETIVLACGRSIFNQDYGVNVASLMLEYGGGGHKGAGSCQVAADDAERVKTQLIREFKGQLTD